MTLLGTACANGWVYLNICKVVFKQGDIYLYTKQNGRDNAIENINKEPRFIIKDIDQWRFNITIDNEQ